MKYIDAIRMRKGCEYSESLLEISELRISNEWYAKEKIYDFLKLYPKTIAANIYPYPYVVPKLSKYGEKYVASEANSTTQDNLLKLPRK